MNLRRSFTFALLPALLTAACYGGPAAGPGGGAGSPSAGPAQTGTTSASYPPPLAPGQKVTISFTNYNLASVGAGKNATELLLREFAEQFPNITVLPRPTPAADLTAKVQAEVVAGNPPDLVQMIFSDLDFAVRSLRAKPLDQIVSAAEFKAYVGGEHPLHPRALKTTELDGKTYGMPYVFSTQTLFYNADIFRQAGLDPAQPPKTWAEVKQYSQQIKAKTGLFGFHTGIEGFALHQDWILQSLVMSNGGYVLTPEG
jgi:multiple sugar transport system substrate-binding protein